MDWWIGGSSMRIKQFVGIGMTHRHHFLQSPYKIWIKGVSSFIFCILSYFCLNYGP